MRTVVEVNNPNHVEHFQRAEADEILVSSQLVSRLMARSSLYPGLAGLVTDIVSGGEGSELYRVSLPDAYVGLSVDELSAKLRAEHRATLLSVSRAGQAYVNPPEDFRLSNGDDLVVVAESLGSLAPLQMDHDLRLGTPGPGIAGSAGSVSRVGQPGRSAGSSAGRQPGRSAGRTPATAMSVPPFQVTSSVSAASTGVPTTRATTSSSGPALTMVSGPSSWQPTVSTRGASASALPLPRTWALVGRDSGPLPRSYSWSTPVPPVEHGPSQLADEHGVGAAVVDPAPTELGVLGGARPGAPRRPGSSAAAVGQRHQVGRLVLAADQEPFQPDLALGVVEPERADRLAARVAVVPRPGGQPRVDQLALGRGEVGLGIDVRHAGEPRAGDRAGIRVRPGQVPPSSAAATRSPARRQRGEVGRASLGERGQGLEVGRAAHQLGEGRVLALPGGGDAGAARLGHRALDRDEGGDRLGGQDLRVLPGLRRGASRGSRPARPGPSRGPRPPRPTPRTAAARRRSDAPPAAAAGRRRRPREPRRAR